MWKGVEMFCSPEIYFQVYFSFSPSFLDLHKIRYLLDMTALIFILITLFPSCLILLSVCPLVSFPPFIQAVTHLKIIFSSRSLTSMSFPPNLQWKKLNHSQTNSMTLVHNLTSFRGWYMFVTLRWYCYVSTSSIESLKGMGVIALSCQPCFIVTLIFRW